MTAAAQVAPGRAGRLRLQQRIAVAQRGAELLDHKLRILRGERERVALQLERSADEWAAASRDADHWLVRGAQLGGERAIRLGSGRALVEVTVRWEQSMGVRYPGEATCALPATTRDSPPLGNAALVLARDGYRRALAAGVRHAAVEAAARVLEAEERATRRRLRAVEDRLIPRLQEALVAVQLTLDEEEHADGVRLRWAARRRVGVDPRAAGTGEPAGRPGR